MKKSIYPLLERSQSEYNSATKEEQIKMIAKLKVDLVVLETQKKWYEEMEQLHPKELEAFDEIKERIIAVNKFLTSI